MHLFNQGLEVAREFGYITVCSNFLLFFTLSIFFNESGFGMIGDEYCLHDFSGGDSFLCNFGGGRVDIKLSTLNYFGDTFVSQPEGK